MVKGYIFVLTVLLLAACSNPNDIRFGASPVEDIQKNEAKLKKLPPEDLALLNSYITFAQSNELKGGSNPAIGKTVAEVLQDARSWKKAQLANVAEKQEEEENGKIHSAQLVAERKLLQNRIAGIITVSLIKRTIIPPNPSAKRSEPVIRLEYNIENKGNKAILAVKGAAIYKDVFNNKIVEHPLQTDKTIPISGHLIIPINYRVSSAWYEMLNLADTDEGKYTFSFSPESLILENGEILSLAEKQKEKAD